MEDDHPSLETLARWLAGELEHEQVRRELVPHLLESCPVCRRMHEEIERLLAERGHWDEAVAVMETRDAPGLLKLLGEGGHEERMRQAEEVEELHTWGVCQLLLEQCRQEVFSDPLRAVETAHLAVRVAGHLVEAYHPGWVLDLRARTHAYLGNARRVLGELKAADDEFLRAGELLEKSGTGNTFVEAEVLSLQGSLRLDQRRLDEALKLADRALDLYRESGHEQGVSKTVLKKAKILKEKGDLPGAIDLLWSPGIDPVREPHLFAVSRQSLASALALAGRHGEAEDLLPEIRDLYLKMAGPMDLARLRWTEALVAHGLGRTEEAEAALREVRSVFLEKSKGYDAALVSLDLAILLTEQGRMEELKRLAAEMLTIFESREIHREATAALILFQRACAEERLTVELIRGIAAQLQESRRGNGSA